IDVLIPESKITSEDPRINQILRDLQAKFPDQVIAYRGNQRWVQIFEPIQLKQSSDMTSRLKKKGVYLISGGLGKIGLIFAEYLAQTVQAKIVLTSRSEFPQPEEYKQWLSRHDESDQISRKIQIVQKLEKMGAEVWVAKADVSNLQQMQQVVTQAEKQFGSLNGVIHAAGILGESYIQTASKTECNQQLHSKVYGLLVLEKILRNKNLDFCLLMSSLSSILGGLGFATYSAANLFMDTFANQHNKSSSFPWISVNWDGWKLEEHEQQKTSFGRDITEWAITPQEGIVALQCILSQEQLSQVVVSTGSLQHRIKKWVKLQSLQETVNLSPEAKLFSNSPQSLSNSLVLPENKTEQMLVSIWQKLLGINQVSSQDNFFELGGDSLMAVQLFAQIETVFQQQLPVSILFKAPTICQLATILEDKRMIEEDDVWSPLVEIQTGGSHPPLFCIHGGGFNILIYQYLATGLGSEYPVYGLQARGLDGSQPLVNGLEDIAADYVREIRRVQPHGPYFLAGLSNGGNIAFEMAQQLKTQGEEVALIAMFDTYAPGSLTLLKPMPRLVSSLQYLLLYSVPRFTKKLLNSKPKEIVLNIRQKAQGLKSQTPPQENRTTNKTLPVLETGSIKTNSLQLKLTPLKLEDGMNRVSQYILNQSPWAFFKVRAQTMEAQLKEFDNPEFTKLKQLETFYNKAYTNYEYKPYAGKIILFKPTETPPGFKRASDLGWGKFALGGVEVYNIPGHHTSIMRSPVLTTYLKHCIDKSI
ncbi:MAG: SDR family oxidoreductase, partial [Cyanobacteriota bacterium]|nr:SDR family oxidoreductase [Cyanobacteriota bacterium]